MALSATIDVVTHFNEVVPNQAIQFQVAVYNSGASSVIVESMTPAITPRDSAYNLAQCFPLCPQTVTAGSTSYFGFSAVFFAPQDSANAPDSIEYTINVYCRDENDVDFAPSPLVLTVYKANVAEVGPPTPPSAQVGEFYFDETTDSGQLLWF